MDAVAPVQIRANASLQTLRRQGFDAAYESATGVANGISAGTMRTVSGVHGVTFDANNCLGAPGCNVHFQFQKAYVGHFPVLPVPGARIHRGAYVKLVMSHDPGCSSCASLEAIQVMRDTRENAHGDIESAQPPGPVREERSGWGDPAAPSRGWRVDAAETATDPLYSHTSVGHTGTGGSPAAIWDAPWSWDTARNVGKHFQSCALCVVPGGARTTLGCVEWGYYIDRSGSIRFRPATPIATCDTTTELADAATRWQAIPGNEPASLSSRSVETPPIPWTPG
jgi:hypothetical protein